MTTLLYNRTSASLLQSTIRMPQLVNFAKEQGYEAIAICDQGVLYGAMEFFHLCQKANIKLLIGLEIMVMIEEQAYPFLVYAKNDAGYQQLIETSTLLETTRPNLTEDELFSLNKNCLIIAPVNDSYLENLLVRKHDDKIDLFLQKYAQLTDFWVGIGPNYSQFNRDNNPIIEEKCQIYKIPVAAISLALYAGVDDYEAFRVLRAICEQIRVNDAQLIAPTDKQLYNPQEMEQLFSPESLQQTDVIASRCNLNMQLPKAFLPPFPTPNNVDSKDYLSGLCQAGLNKRMDGKTISQSYQMRLNYELKVIIQMHFEDYFLIVWDFIRYARQQGIYVGVGRGSAAGSLVAYCLGITHIDPLKYGLLFERFLNPERISMPDIDTDFPDDRRQEVIDYVTEKYGRDHIAHIVAFATLAAKQVIKDAGKALGVNSSVIDILTRNIPNQPKITLKMAYEQNPQFKKAVESAEANRNLYQIALRLEGLPHHISTHAAGLVMSGLPLTQNVPLLKVDENTYATQYPMQNLEELGLIKMDFLGLRNLTTIAQIVETINQTAKVPLNILKIPLDNQATYELIGKGQTIGVFQLESSGMVNLLKKMLPTCFEDIVVTVALFRPGPMENIPLYLQARSHPETVTYPHPDLIPILKPTYGIMIYQEQIMQVAQVMAGFSLGKADLLRKAVSKKQAESLQSLQADFVSGARKKGYDDKVINHVYELILKFANYGFNKSHSVAYALLAYQMAYLKANYPLPFYQALLNSVVGNEDKTAQYIMEARSKGIQMLSPDINKSTDHFIIEGNNLRFPITAIKGIGLLTAMPIIEERNEHGLYLDFIDFICRANQLGMSRKVMETFIDAGCLDNPTINRTGMHQGLTDVLRYAELIKVDDNGTISLKFDLVSRPLLTSGKEDSQAEAQNEFNLLGLYLHGHPAESRRKLFPKACDSVTARLHKGYIETVVQLIALKQHRTVKGDLMCFATGQDEMGTIELAIMPDLFRQLNPELKKGQLVYLTGYIDEQRPSVKVKTLKVLE